MKFWNPVLALLCCCLKHQPCRTGTFLEPVSRTQGPILPPAIQSGPQMPGCSGKPLRCCLPGPKVSSCGLPLLRDQHRPSTMQPIRSDSMVQNMWTLHGNLSLLSENSFHFSMDLSWLTHLGTCFCKSGRLSFEQPYRCWGYSRIRIQLCSFCNADHLKLR